MFNESPTYTPASLVNVFNNVLSAEPVRRTFTIKGIYVPGKGMNYGGVYFDTLKDEYSDASVTLIVPALLRTSLQSQQLIECSAFLTKKVQPNGSRIELQVNVTEVHSQQQTNLTEEQVQVFELLQQKASHGYKDVDAFIRTRVIQQQPVRVAIIIGRTGIIDSDINHQLKDALAFYQVSYVRVSLVSETEIVQALSEYDTKTDILVLSRGGGENMGIFNRASLAEAILPLQSFFVTAIGHKEDVSLVQKIADKPFITPTAFGQYLNDIYTQTIFELQDSKAKLVEDITKQLKGSYDLQLQHLQERLQNTNELNSKELAIRQEQINNLQLELARKKPFSLTTLLLIAIAAAIGIMIGKGCF